MVSCLRRDYSRLHIYRLWFFGLVVSLASHLRPVLLSDSKFKISSYSSPFSRSTYAFLVEYAKSRPSPHIDDEARGKLEKANHYQATAANRLQRAADRKFILGQQTLKPYETVAARAPFSEALRFLHRLNSISA